MAINGKYLTYKAMKENLKRAITSEFYYEAIFIEYAILEDRLESLLRHAGVNVLDKNGHAISYSNKVKVVKSNARFHDKFIMKKITSDFLDELKSWSNKRNRLVHALAKMPYCNDSLKEVALEGNELVKIFDNKVKSVNNYFDKNNHSYNDKNTL